MTNTDATTANALIHETSPYLLQHAHNPVHWYPWGEEALNKARAENKPILLSIGYAACHWCHVMAHESFEEAETAELMNRLFINIKVDREERPDLDKVYQNTHYILTQRGGGWPLTVFLTPTNQAPYFSGTYFPLHASATHQLPAFKDLLNRMALAYQHHAADIQRMSAELLEILNPPLPIINDVRLNQQPLQHAIQVLERNYDQVNGGFGGAPKFPQPTKLSLLLNADSPLAFNTLKHMANGGIYDQLGGGFFRYAVDAQWRIPHFEKMLYDNAQLLELYARAYKKTGEDYYAKIARETADWVIMHMQAPEGGYYSSMDADTEGHEGLYYVWDKSEMESLLSASEWQAVQTHFGLNQSANFEKRWHLYIADENNTDMQSTKKKLLTAREKRTAPAIDKKILTAWNALMIKAMLIAGESLQEPRFIASAQKALSYIQTQHWKNEHLLATQSLPAYLDDYAFLTDALVTSAQITNNQTHLSVARQLTDTLLQHFSDPEGGFYFTANDHEQLFYRPKSMMDEAIPSGNAIAAHCLFLLSSLLNEPRYRLAAERTLHAAWPLLTQHPAEHSAMLETLSTALA